MPINKTLYLLRHAKAETGSPSGDDHVRMLNDVGVEACALAGKYMAKHGITPQLVLCSTAERAKTTWELVAQASKNAALVQYSDSLYLASPPDILRVLAVVPDTVQSVMVVGHNPGLHQLCVGLATQGDEELLERLAVKFPTCAVAAIGVGNTPWSGLAHANGELQGFVTPKMLK